MIPDAPKLPPWVLGYAEYDGRRVVLGDRDSVHERSSRPERYAVGAGYPLTPCGDLERELGFDLPSIIQTDDEAEARAVFEREAERLRA